MPEFDLIQRLQRVLCNPPVASPLAPIIGIGDDAAVLEVPPDRQLVVTTDTLVEGVHFLPGTTAADLGYKSLAVNLSDLAAMGAEPAWFFLALTLPEFNSAWLDDFARGLAELAGATGITLAGGDTTSGPLSVTLTAMGLVGKGQALKRSGALEGDLVAVSGTLGDAACALKSLAAGDRPDDECRKALDRPLPRLSLGLLLRDLATSCIDISDGLLADLGHILRASGMGAEIEIQKLPCSSVLAGLGEEERLKLQTSGGDDYELCFTFPAARRGELESIAETSGSKLTVIGTINASGRLVCKAADGTTYHPAKMGYEHFAGRPGADQ